MQKKPAVCPVDSLASALREQLTYDRDSDSLTTSPSSSSLDTCSSQKIFQAFGKSGGSPVHQETSVAGEAREAREDSGSSFSEMDGCNEEPKIARSVTDGELRHRILNPLSHHGVSAGSYVSFPSNKTKNFKSVLQLDTHNPSKVVYASDVQSQTDTRWSYMFLHSYFNELLPNLRMINYTEEVKTVFGQALSKNPTVSVFNMFFFQLNKLSTS